jgi:uncharacterized protein YndB with AHSA1/START domain
MSACTPQDLVFADRAPWTFDVQGAIAGSRREVWDAFVDNEGWTGWFNKCLVCRATSTPFGGVGSTRHIEVNGLTVDERFIGWEPEVLWAFTVTDIRPSFASGMVERATFTDLPGERTLISYRIAVRPKWWAAPLRRIIAKQMANTFALSFAALDRHINGSRPT